VAFHYVGKGLEDVQELRGLAPNVQVVGSVDDLAEWYYRADAVIAPIFEGGGMKVKTAEALMYGRRVFGTGEALVGYEHCGPEVCLRCDSKEEYRTALAAQLERAHEADDVAVVRSAFLRDYSDSCIDRRLEETLARLLS
jgi:glycosyltransferase involved in cell wall biosynthesis